MPRKSTWLRDSQGMADDLIRNNTGTPENKYSMNSRKGGQGHDPFSPMQLPNEQMNSDEESRGGTKKVADIPETCNDPEHFPPMHRVYKPGVYEHTCPKCGQVQSFTVPNVSL